MGHGLAIALRLQHVHDVVGVFEHAVVHGAAAARTGTLIVHAQAAADVYGTNGRTQLMQLRVETGTFFQAGLDIADVGNLGAQMEVKQLEAVQGTCLAQCLHHVQNLACGQAELGLLTTGVLPVALANGSQPRAHANQRRYTKAFGFFQDQRQLGLLLHNNKYPVPEFLANQGQADVLAVFIAVADNHGAGLTRQRQNRHQFRLAASFQTHLAG